MNVSTCLHAHLSGCPWNSELSRNYRILSRCNRRLETTLVGRAGLGVTTIVSSEYVLCLRMPGEDIHWIHLM